MSPRDEAARPGRLIVVVGTGTGVGKTWVSQRLLASARARGLRVAARKPAQSYAADESGTTDAHRLGEATGEAPEIVCPRHRWYPAAMAPPMAADALGRDPIRLGDLLQELGWPKGIDVGLVETAGGVRSPLAHDGDSAALAHALAPTQVLLVADAGLGTLSAVRLSGAALAPLPLTIFLNRFDPSEELHRRNRDWLSRIDRFEVITGLE